MKLSDKSPSLLEFAADCDIPVEWLKPNCTRLENNKGWLFKGYTDFPQIRYDTPPLTKTGKQLRYKAFPRTPTDVAIPYTPDGKLAVDHRTVDEWITITEGLKKAIKACSVDIPTISCAGVWNGLRKQKDGTRQLTPTLEKILLFGHRKFIISFDSDCATNKNVILATYELAQKLIEAGCDVKIATGLWQVEQGKGMDDFISNNGSEAMKEILENALQLDDWVDKYHSGVVTKKGKLTHAEMVQELGNFYGDRIKYNEMTNEVEKDDDFYQLDMAYIDISQEVGLETNKTAGVDYVVKVSQNNSYHPVVNYLESVKDLKGNADIDNCIADIHGKLTEILGVTNVLELTFLTKTLVAAVKRVYEPGCFFKRVCILYGGQDLGKSSFWRELASDYFFNDSYKGTNDKDDLMSLHSAWINEISEFDKVYKKIDVANLKGVISSPFDKVRLPYGKSITTLKRRSILTGTTNRKDVLLDPTGYSRFWVVGIHRKVNFDSLLKYRDEIWSLATRLYELDYSINLNQQEQQQHQEHSESFTSFDPLYDDVYNACLDVNTGELMEYVVIAHIWEKLYPEQANKKLERRDWMPISEVLTRLGYDSGHKKRFDGRLVSCWKLQKSSQGTVTAVTTPESQTQQGVPFCYSSVTDKQGTVTSDDSGNSEQLQVNSQMLPSDSNGNGTVTPTVTQSGQGFEGDCYRVTANPKKNSNHGNTDWKPNVNKLVIYGNDMVMIVGGDGKRWQVQHLDSNGNPTGKIYDNIATCHLKQPD